MNLGDGPLDVVAHEQLVNLATMRANQAHVESATQVNIAQCDQLNAGAELLRARATYWKRLATCIGWATAALVVTVIVLLIVVV